jgi:hypothetical protein
MTTASNPLNPAEVLGELDALKAAVETAARAERQADEARTARVVAARREMRGQEERLAMEHERRRTELEGRHAGEREAAEARHVARLERIEACYHSARRALTNEVTGARDSRVGQVQGEMMARQEELKEGYERAQRELVGLRAAAEEDLAKVAEMTDEARKALRGFKPLVSARLGGRGVKVGEAVEGDLLGEAALDLEAVQRLPLAKFFRFVPLTALLVLAIGLSAWLSGSPG